MPEPNELIRYCRFLDKQAEEWLLRWIPELNSQFLNYQVLEWHTRDDGTRVRMVDQVNLVITATGLDGARIGFLAAQIDCDVAVAIVHMVYVLPEFRRTKAAMSLLQAFEFTLGELGESYAVRAGIVNRASLGLFRQMSQMSRYRYELKVVSDEQLDKGDEMLRSTGC